MRGYTLFLIVVAIVESAIQMPAAAQDSPTPARSGQTTTIDIGDVCYTLPFTMPSATDILRGRPNGQARLPNERIHCELVLFKRHDPKFYPLVGRASLVETHFKCTTISDGQTEVVYIDRDHLVAEK